MLNGNKGQFKPTRPDQRVEVMSVLKQKRTTSKAEFINTAYQIYVETLNFLTRLSARYSRLIAEPTAKLAGEIIDHAEKAKDRKSVV